MDKGLIVHALIFNEEKKVLIIRRSAANDYLPGLWDIPGGTLEDGEDPAAGAAREAKEESGIDTGNLNLFFHKSNVDQKKNKQFFTFVFLAQSSGGEIKLNPEEHDDYAWISLEDSGKYEKVDYLQACFDLLSSKKHNILKF
ncbi:MAG: NUDIX hydrolase [Candidatus Falkowbacteria bacterium]